MLATSVASSLCHQVLEVAHVWSPAAASRVRLPAAAHDSGDWVLDGLERLLRSAGLHVAEVDALYQHVSEAAEHRTRRAEVARMADEP